MSRRQKGRKPHKSFHRRGAARNLERATKRWPDLGVDVPYDGEPTALRQQHAKRKGTAS